MSKEELKNRFKNGMTPDEDDFGELIDLVEKETRKYPTLVKTPVEFKWKDHPLEGLIHTDNRGGFLVDYNIEDKKLSGGKEYHVNGTSGDDNNNGLSKETAFKSLRALEGKTDDGDTIYIYSGDYYRNLGDLTTAINSKSVNFIGVGKSVNFIKSDATSWAKTVGTTYTYEASRSVVARVVDFNRMDGKIPREFKKVGSVEEVESTVDSWFTDGTKVFAHYSNQPNEKVAPLLAASALRIDDPSSDFYMENINMYGGTEELTFSMSSHNNLYLNRVGIFLSTRGNGLSVTGGNLIVSVDSEASHNMTDGFNYHNGKDGSKPKVIEINCKAYNNGFEKGLDGFKSNNGSSIHNNMFAIRINGDYGRNDGGNITDVNDGSQSWNLGCAAFESYQEKDFQVSGGADMFLDSCTSFGSKQGVRGLEGDRVFLRLGSHQHEYITGERILY